MSQAAMAQDESEDRYYTQVEAGDVRLFTLDQLDAAFNAGLIHENTYVCLEGESEWQTLGEVAGLGQEDAGAPISAQLPTPHYGLAASPSVLPAQYLPAVMIAPSIAPVVNDLSLTDFDSDMLSMRPKRRVGKVVAGLAVLGLGALGFMVVQSGGLRGLQLPMLDKVSGGAAAASVSLSGVNEARTASEPKPQLAAPPAAPAAELPKVDPPQPSSVASALESKAKGEPAAQKGDDRFSDDMKAALLSKDKQQAATQKSKKAARTTASSKQKLAKSGKAKGASGFKSGGSAYDPLNGKL